MIKVNFSYNYINEDDELDENYWDYNFNMNWEAEDDEEIESYLAKFKFFLEKVGFKKEEIEKIKLT